MLKPPHQCPLGGAAAPSLPLSSRSRTRCSTDSTAPPCCSPSSAAECCSSPSFTTPTAGPSNQFIHDDDDDNNSNNNNNIIVIIIIVIMPSLFLLLPGTPPSRCCRCRWWHRGSATWGWRCCGRCSSTGLRCSAAKRCVSRRPPSPRTLTDQTPRKQPGAAPPAALWLQRHSWRTLASPLVMSRRAGVCPDKGTLYCVRAADLCLSRKQEVMWSCRRYDLQHLRGPLGGWTA